MFLMIVNTDIYVKHNNSRYHAVYSLCFGITQDKIIKYLRYLQKNVASNNKLLLL